MARGVQTEWCTVPKPEWMNVTAKHKRERERISSYFTPMQHAEEIQLPFRLHS